jgi:hypothetical protein
MALGRTARRVAEEQFSAGRQVAVMVEHYAALLARRP